MWIFNLCLKTLFLSLIEAWSLQHGIPVRRDSGRNGAWWIGLVRQRMHVVRALVLVEIFFWPKFYLSLCVHNWAKWLCRLFALEICYYEVSPNKLHSVIRIDANLNLLRRTVNCKKKVPKIKLMIREAAIEQSENFSHWTRTLKTCYVSVLTLKLNC